MTWPWQRDRIKPTEAVFVCPKCGSDQPAYALAALGNWVRRWGRAHGVPTGARVSCQACGWIYCVGPRGTFDAHHDAFPRTPVQAPSGVATQPQRPGQERALPPPPKEPPPW